MSTTVPVRLSCVSLPSRRFVGGGRRAAATTVRRPTLPVASKASSWRHTTYSNHHLVPNAPLSLSRLHAAAAAHDDDGDMNNRDVAVRASSSASSSAPSLESMCDPETYGGESNLWVTQELPRLLETLPKKRPCDGLVLTRGSWTATTATMTQEDGQPTTTKTPTLLRLNGLMRFHNTTKGRFDMFVPEVHPRVSLISKRGLPPGVTATVRCIPRHEDDDPPARPDDYWAAYIVPVHGETTMEVEVEIASSSSSSLGGVAAAKDLGDLATLDAAFVRVEYVVYGHHGRTTQEQQVVLPLRFPEVMDAEGTPEVMVTTGAAVDDDDANGDDAGEITEEEEEESSGAKGGFFFGGGGGFLKKNKKKKNEEEMAAASASATTTTTTTTATNKLSWKEVKPGLSVLCVPTHLLCHMDDPVSVVRRYVQRHARPGDMVSIGETPLAVMQGRTRHPVGVRPGLIAKFVCKLFNRFSSIATACGMQCLVDVSGGLRVLLAAAAAVAARLFGKRGVFYKLAGTQANLIDDVSGTLPPYDQFITLGPVKVRETVDAVRSRLGLPCAIVDVNDLTAIKGKFLVLAKSEGVDEDILRMALLRNPAGNADQQTPLVLIRHDPARRSELLAAAAEDEKNRKERARRKGGIAFVQK